MDFYFLYVEINIKIPIEVAGVSFIGDWNFPCVLCGIAIAQFIPKQNLVLFLQQLLGYIRNPNKINH